MIKLRVKTSSRIQAINITGQVIDAVRGKDGGLCHVYTPHTTCGLIVNEQADPDVEPVEKLSGEIRLGDVEESDLTGCVTIAISDLRGVS
jgi:hypothetical protein